MADRLSILEEFKQSGGLLEGHFLLSSGLHSPKYMQCALVLEDPVRAARLGVQIAQLTAECDTVVSPALGGVIIGHEVARAKGVRFLFTERDAEARTVLRRGFRIRPDERIVVVEDVVTTGLSTREVLEVVEGLGGLVVGAAAIVDRSGGAARFTVPFHALLTIDVPTYPAKDCPLCSAGSQAVKPGSRRP